MMAVNIKTRSVNSKLLFNEIDELVTMGIDETGINWSSASMRESFVDLLSDAFREMVEDDKIEQWKVQCDKRNNIPNNLITGPVTLDLFYKQKNCLNTTQLTYEIDMTDDEYYTLSYY